MQPFGFKFFEKGDPGRGKTAIMAARNLGGRVLAVFICKYL